MENMVMEKIFKKEKPQDPFLIESVSYEGTESDLFDSLLRTRRYIEAPMDGVSEVTKDEILFSGWHVPCHCILVKAGDGSKQIFHIQPNKLGSSLLTLKQSKALKQFSNKNACAIVAKGMNSWFGIPDIQELKDFGIDFLRAVDTETRGRWRFLYDPASNQIWIDIQDKKQLNKYKGF